MMKFDPVLFEVIYRFRQPQPLPLQHYMMLVQTSYALPFFYELQVALGSRYPN
jgi:hypothetical protein